MFTLLFIVLIISSPFILFKYRNTVIGSLIIYKLIKPVVLSLMKKLK